MQKEVFNLIKLRVEGPPKEVEKYIEKLRESNKILQESKPYKNRNSEYVRVYLDVESK